MKSYIIGFIGLLLTFSIFLLIRKYFNLNKTDNIKPNRVLFYSFLGVIISAVLFYLFKTIFPIPESEVDLWERILFTLLLTPLIEELIFRKGILGYFINLEKKTLTKEDFLINFLLFMALTLPSALFYFIGLICPYDSLKLIMLVFLLVPLVLLKFNSHKNHKLYLLLILISQTFIFVLSHGVYASKPLIATGLLYGILYLQSRSIVPPLIAHYVHNLLVFIYT